eukprot:TRINITY_DN17563_c0_g1_i1.p1 TRINITY_DN17563_c0_g1~~TRINITY_DN17563_c0_g1_i1.p1  ORF type:complete len:860 (-),score=237.36 TRINITY_DN17563_c0_g1_i1:28-2607(-)
MPAWRAVGAAALSCSALVGTALAGEASEVAAALDKIIEHAKHLETGTNDERNRPEYCDKKDYEGPERPCKGKTMVLDIGGYDVRTWCFKDGHKPMKFPEPFLPMYRLWDGNPQSECKEPDLTYDMLKKKYDKFVKQFGKPKNTVVSINAATENPGAEAYSATPRTLPSLEPIAWGNDNRTKGWKAVNDVISTILGGFQYIDRWTKKHGVPDGLNVIAFSLAGFPTGGYVQRREDKLRVVVRSSWLYGKNSAQFKDLKTEDKDREDVCLHTTKPLYGTNYYEAKDNMYVPILEKDKNLTLDIDERRFVSPGELSEQLGQKGQFRYSGVIPYTHILTAANVEELVRKDNWKMVSTHSGESAPYLYLSPDTEHGQIWRQRVTQALYSWTNQYEKEVACVGTNQHIVLMGGHATALGGRLHKWVARTGANGPYWVHVQSGHTQKEMPAEMNDPEKGVLRVDSEEEPILNFGRVCKFKVHMMPYYGDVKQRPNAKKSMHKKEKDAEAKKKKAGGASHMNGYDDGMSSSGNGMSNDMGGAMGGATGGGMGDSMGNSMNNGFGGGSGGGNGNVGGSNGNQGQQSQYDIYPDVQTQSSAAMPKYGQQPTENYMRFFGKDGAHPPAAGADAAKPGMPEPPGGHMPQGPRGPDKAPVGKDDDTIKVHGFPYKIGSPTTWAFNEMAGAGYFLKLKFDSEVHQSAFFPWRTPKDGGWCTDDRLVMFTVSDDNTTLDDEEEGDAENDDDPPLEDLYPMPVEPEEDPQPCDGAADMKTCPTPHMCFAPQREVGPDEADVQKIKQRVTELRLQPLLFKMCCVDIAADCKQQTQKTSECPGLDRCKLAYRPKPTMYKDLEDGKKLRDVRATVQGK